jgi:hypothetical protein
MVQFHCNDKEMLNVKLSEKICDSYLGENNKWKEFWEVKAEEIIFSFAFSGSYQYRGYRGEPFTILRWLTNDTYPFCYFSFEFYKFEMKAQYTNQNILSLQEYCSFVIGNRNQTDISRRDHSVTKCFTVAPEYVTYVQKKTH